MTASESACPSAVPRMQAVTRAVTPPVAVAQGCPSACRGRSVRVRPLAAANTYSAPCAWPGPRRSRWVVSPGVAYSLSWYVKAERKGW